jgi:RNA polymerase sigma-70 factor (ECF subfamily)
VDAEVPVAAEALRLIDVTERDRPYADVAAELGVTPGTLRTRVYYGLRRLRRVLETETAAA